MKIKIFKMSQAYEGWDLKRFNIDYEILDFTNLEGTRCYCDDLAFDQLEKAFENTSAGTVHKGGRPDITINFIDSGNYHYLSYMSLKQIKEPFALLLFDHHPDDQPPAFADVLSCGGWVKKALEDNPMLKKVYTVGVAEKYFDLGTFLEDELPVYVSIDKDFLNQNLAVTDWDQGEGTIEDIKPILCHALRGSDAIPPKKMLGMDICGDTSEPNSHSDDVNLNTNIEIIKLLQTMGF